jgi:8-oxo-dGTP diphosphatase
MLTSGHKASPSEPLYVVAAALCDDEDRILLSRRPEHLHQGGLWEFPGGKVERDETPLQGLARELDEELGISLKAARPLIQVVHDYIDRRVLLDVWWVAQWLGQPAPREGQTIEWVDRRKLSERAFPAADAAVVSAVRLPPVYLISPEPGRDLGAFLGRLETCLTQGVELVQLRVKRQPAAVAEITRRALSLFGDNQALIVNADPVLARELGAHGVHLSAARLRSLTTRPLDDSHWVGASCHNAEELAHAGRIGVDYAVLSPVEKTSSHSRADPLGWERFQALVAKATVPVYALGGLRVADLAAAWQHGAQGVASVSAVWNHPQSLRALRATR